MIRKLSASLMALALAGCVNLAPDHERPALASAPVEKSIASVAADT